MKSERLKGLSTTTSPSCNYYTSFSVQTLPREQKCSEFSSTTDEGDIEEYYPFVIGRGKAFKIIDPKIYKQLRKNNIHQTKNIRIAECAKKKSKSKTHEICPKSSSVSSEIENEDEYCELSPLANSPAPIIPPRRTKLSAMDAKDSVKKLSSSQKRIWNEYYDPKTLMVQVNSSSDTVTTKICHSTADSGKALFKDSDEKNVEQFQTNEQSRTYLCGHDTEELLDYSTCMCCVKGLFYHCTKDSESEGRIADDPCSCSGPLKSCLPRWGCLAVLSLLLPCLWCYLPIAGCRKAAICISCKKKKNEKKKTSVKGKRTLTS